jgi:hypothetical protein
MRTTRAALLSGLAVFGFILLLPAAAPAQERVFKTVSGNLLEQLLSGMNIQYRKSKGSRDGISLYDYTNRDNHNIRLQNFDGKDLWIEYDLNGGASLDEVNSWNVRAKFSRAVLVRDKNRTHVSLEFQLDCLGGVTEGMIRQLINRFDGEIRDFHKHLKR